MTAYTTWGQKAGERVAYVLFVLMTKGPDILVVMKLHDADDNVYEA